MLKEEIYPSGQVNLVGLVAHHHLLQQLVDSLEDVTDLDTLSSVIAGFAIVLDENEGKVESIDYLD